MTEEFSVFTIGKEEFLKKEPNGFDLVKRSPSGVPLTIITVGRSLTHGADTEDILTYAPKLSRSDRYGRTAKVQLNVGLGWPMEEKPNSRVSRNFLLNTSDLVPNLIRQILEIDEETAQKAADQIFRRARQFLANDPHIILE